MSRVIQCMIFALIATSASAGSMFLEQNAKVVLNDSNYLIFEDVGRITKAEGAITFGRFVRLHITRDGKQHDINLVDPAYANDEYDPRYPLVGSEVMQIKYRDKDSVWIISHGSPYGDFVVLLNIATDKLVTDYHGSLFAISPDARHIAYGFAWGMTNFHHVVFVNDVMVYPAINQGIVRTLEEPVMKERGVPFREFTRGFPTSELGGGILWRDDHTIEFVMKENLNETTKTQAVKYVVSGIASMDDSVSTETIRVTRSEVAAPNK